MVMLLRQVVHVGSLLLLVVVGLHDVRVIAAGSRPALIRRL